MSIAHLQSEFIRLRAEKEVAETLYREALENRKEAIHQARNEALEEAAKVAINECSAEAPTSIERSVGLTIAAAIRALKG